MLTKCPSLTKHLIQGSSRLIITAPNCTWQYKLASAINWHQTKTVNNKMNLKETTAVLNNRPLQYMCTSKFSLCFQKLLLFPTVILSSCRTAVSRITGGEKRGRSGGREGKGGGNGGGKKGYMKEMDRKEGGQIQRALGEIKRGKGRREKTDKTVTEDRSKWVCLKLPIICPLLLLLLTSGLF